MLASVSMGWLAGLRRDFRHGFVLLRRDAGPSVLIIVVLALGIGGNAAIFTLLKAAFLDALPFREPGRLVTIRENNGWNPSVSEFLQVRARSRTLEQFAFAEYRDMQVSGTVEPVRVYVARVTASFFPLLGATTTLGHTFTDEDNQPGRTPAVILTDGFWRRHMGASRGSIGQTLRVDGQSAVVIGVLPASFRFDYPTLGIQEPVDFYVASSLDGRTEPVRVLARLRPGVTLPQAEADLQSIAHAFAAEHAYPKPPGVPDRFTFEMLPLRDAIVGTQRSLLWLLSSGACMLLLIACANTAQLLLARSLQRTREVAIRSALGASRLRLIRQFLMEGLVLALLGGIAGLAAAVWITRLLIALLPAPSPLLASAHIDSRVFVFTLAISVFSALVFAIVPAVKASGMNSWMAMREGNRWRHAMIAMEAALSVLLLCGAGLIAQNLWTLITTPMGFVPNHVLAMQLKLPNAKPQDSLDPNAGRAFQEYLDKIEAIPAVESAATVTGPPLRRARGGNAELRGFRDPSGELKIVWADNHLVSPDYFRTLRIPLLAGRLFRRDDAGRKVSVAIVNQEFARQFGLGADVVGKQIDEGPDEPTTIVGMVGNVRTRGLQTDPYPEVYLSSLQLEWVNVYLVVRSQLPPGQLVQQIKAAIRSSNADQAVFGVLTMDELIADSQAGPRFDVFLIGSFALLAVAMAAAGMYSVIACLVSQRSRELAIRMALGATRRNIIETVFAATGAWVVAGLLCGVGLGLATRNTVRTLSASAVTGSSWIYISVVVLFVVVTLAAAYLPLHRASRLDPAAALRCE